MKKHKIIIIDDDALIRNVVATFLRGQGYQVQVAPNAELGLELASREQPDLMILDLFMPEKDGFDTLAEFRSELKSWRTKVIMLSSAGQYQKMEAAFEIGADAYLTKPFDPAELRDKIAELLGEKAPAAA